MAQADPLCLLPYAATTARLQSCHQPRPAVQSHRRQSRPARLLLGLARPRSPPGRLTGPVLARRFRHGFRNHQTHPSRPSSGRRSSLPTLPPPTAPPRLSQPTARPRAAPPQPPPARAQRAGQARRRAEARSARGRRRAGRRGGEGRGRRRPGRERVNWARRLPGSSRTPEPMSRGSRRRGRLALRPCLAGLEAEGMLGTWRC